MAMGRVTVKQFGEEPVTHEGDGIAYQWTEVGGLVILLNSEFLLEYLPGCVESVEGGPKMPSPTPL